MLENSGKLLQEKGECVYCSLLPSYVRRFIHYVRLAERNKLERRHRKCNITYSDVSAGKNCGGGGSGERKILGDVRVSINYVCEHGRKLV
jgi:hypothetical protein